MATNFVADEDYVPQPAKPVHPLCRMLRELRRQTRLSLGQIQERYGMPAVVLGAYERGDREPPMTKLEQAFALYGYKLTAVPIDDSAIILDVDMVAQLRGIAAQLEARSVS